MGHDQISRVKIQTGSSAVAEGPRDALRQLKFSTAAQLYEKSHIKGLQ